jgi:hypothetical protein
VTDNPAVRRLRLALDMYELGESMQRTRLRRLHPELTDTQLDAEISAWLISRSGGPTIGGRERASTRFA